MISRSRRSENHRTTAINDSYHRLYQKLNADVLENVGNYQIVRQIGEGSFGKVYMAIHKLTKTKVVLKSGSKADPNVIREIFFHKQAFHDNITKLYEVIVTETNVYLAIEYCPNGELFDYFISKSCRLTFKEIKQIFSHVVGAVYYIHTLNISHRDLKLENILLDKKNHCKLSDFGFSRDCFKNSALKTICGTHVYMAPELLMMSGPDKSYNGFKIDMWALGVILYTLVYGQMPFEEDDEEIAKLKIVNDEPNYQLRPILMTANSSPSSPISNTTSNYESFTNENGVPEEAVELIKLLLQKDPSNRPNSLEMVLNHRFLDYYGQKSLKYTNGQIQFSRNFTNHQFESYFERHLLKHLKRLGFDTKKIKDSVTNRKCDQLDGIWYLLLEKESKREKLKEKFRQIDKDRREKNNSISGLIGSGKRLSQIRSSLTKDFISLPRSSSLNKLTSQKSSDSLKPSRSVKSEAIKPTREEDVLQPINSINSRFSKRSTLAEESNFQDETVSLKSIKNVQNIDENFNPKQDHVKFKNIFDDEMITSTPGKSKDTLDAHEFRRGSTASQAHSSLSHKPRNGRKSSFSNISLRKYSTNNDNNKHKSKAFMDKLKFWIHKAGGNNENNVVQSIESSTNASSGKLSASTSKKSNDTAASSILGKNIKELTVTVPKGGEVIDKEISSNENENINDEKAFENNVLAFERASEDDQNKVINDNKLVTGRTTPTSDVSFKGHSHSRSLNQPSVSYSKIKQRPGSMISTYSAFSQVSDLSQLSFNGTVLSMDTPTLSNYGNNSTSGSTVTKPKYHRSKSSETRFTTSSSNNNRKSSGGGISAASYSPSTSEQSSRKSSFYDYSTGSFNYRSNSPDPFGESYYNRYNVINQTFHKLNGEGVSTTLSKSTSILTKSTMQSVDELSSGNEGGEEEEDNEYVKNNTRRGRAIRNTHSSAFGENNRYSARRKSPLGGPYSNYGLAIGNFKPFGNVRKKQNEGVKGKTTSIIEEEEVDSFTEK